MVLENYWVSDLPSPRGSLPFFVRLRFTPLAPSCMYPLLFIVSRIIAPAYCKTRRRDRDRDSKVTRVQLQP